MDYDSASRKCKFTIFYELIDTKGKVEKHIFYYTLRYLYTDDIEFLMRLTGYTLNGKYGNYNLSPYNIDEKNERVIYDISCLEEIK